MVINAESSLFVLGVKMVRKKRSDGGGEGSEPQQQQEAGSGQGSGAQRPPAQQQQPQGGYQGRGQQGGYQGRGQQGGYQGGHPQGGRGWPQRGGGGGPQQYYGGPPDQLQQGQQQRPPRGTAPPQRRGGPGPSYAGGPSRPSVPELYQATQAPQQPVATLQPMPYEEESTYSTQQMVDDSTTQFQQLSVQQEETALQIAPASSKSVRFPLRPGKGSTGIRCIVKANHFFAELPDKDLHQYDVSLCFRFYCFFMSCCSLTFITRPYNFS